VVAVNFQPGDRVKQGAVLVELDARDEKLALELAKLRLSDAERTLGRYTRANSSVELTVPETTVDTARTALDSARIERDRAQIALQRRFVTAPFDGYVGITDVDAGDRIDTTTEITTIDDRSVLLVSFDVPEAFVGSLNTDDPVRIEVWSAGRTEANGRIVDLGSRVDPLSRAFTARAEVPNPEDSLRPGMSFRVELDLVGAAYPAVPDVALQWGAEGAYIWIVEGDRVRRVAAGLIQRQEGRVLVDADVPAGAQVVGEGVQSMRDGIAVRTMDAEALARDARGALMPAASEG
jgi:RND family efflux transporter MFP subunit